jgi:hypothetical protein
MTTVKLRVKETELQNFIEVVNKLQYTEIEEIENSSIQKGAFKADEKPSAFAGIWKDDKRTLTEIRKKAWKQNN